MNLFTRTGTVVRGLALAVGLSLLGTQASAQDTASGRVEALAYEPATDMLFKATELALARSSDAGRSWASVPLPLQDEDRVSAIAVAAGGGTLYVAGPGLGVLRSEDDGASWHPISGGLPSNDVVALAAHSTQPETLYVAVSGEGIFRSQDSGSAWRLMDRGPEGIRHLVHTNMAGSMETGWLYAATNQGARVSMDCFCLWRDAGGLAGAVNGIAFVPSEPSRLYAATALGLFLSADGGMAWQSAAPAAPALTALAVADSGLVFVSGENGEFFVSRDGAATWEQTGD